MVQPFLGSRGVSTVENWCPMSHLTALVRRYGTWYPVGWWRSRYDRMSRVLAYQTGLRAKLESERAVGAWNSTTELLSGLDRPQCLCVLRLRGSSHETQWTGAWCPPPPPPHASAFSLRALVMWSSTIIRSEWVHSKEKRHMPDLDCTYQHFLTSCMAKGMSVEHPPSQR